MAYSNHATTLYGDTIIKFPLMNNEMGFFGIGKVIHIARGEKADMVSVIFAPEGKGEVFKSKTVIVAGNFPRRQLLTVKHGQYALFYGRCVLKNLEEREINGKMVTPRKWEFFAYAIQGLYVPNAFDVKKAHKDKVDEELFTEMNESETKLLNDIIDDLWKYKGASDDENEE